MRACTPFPARYAGCRRCRRGACVRACVNCAAVVAEVAFCPECGGVLPLAGHDHFERLGIAEGVEINRGELDRAYFAMQMSLHPDRFARGSERDRALAMAHAASLNDAYGTLRDPFLLADYLLTRLTGRGVASTEETIADPALLMEQLECREQLDEAEGVEALQGLEAGAVLRLREHETAFRQAYGAGSAEDCRGAVLRMRYGHKLLDEIRTRLRLHG